MASGQTINPDVQDASVTIPNCEFEDEIARCAAVIVEFVRDLYEDVDSCSHTRLTSILILAQKIGFLADRQAWRRGGLMLNGADEWGYPGLEDELPPRPASVRQGGQHV